MEYKLVLEILNVTNQATNIIYKWTIILVVVIKI